MCDCSKNRKKVPGPSVRSPAVRTVRTASPVGVPAHPLACRDCLNKHLGAAAEYAKEAEEDATRTEEYRRAIGHMVCAEDHARALNLADFASRIRLARKTFQESRKAADLESLLKEPI